tara:strand:- start:2386 stop:2757 length:372 start_codon:yes stop_codon:yes gene_type:complete
MNVNNYIDLTKTYVALLNKHNRKRIIPMLIDEATYHSSFFGESKSSQTINEMMVKFFSRFSNAYWDVAEYRCIEENSVEFEFIMTATDAISDEHIEWHGVEQIHFTTDNLISCIAVRKQDESR